MPDYAIALSRPELDALLRDVIPLLRRQASRLLGEDADDAVQTACLKLLKASDAWLAHPNPTAYAMRAVTTAAYDLKRRQSQDMPVDEVPDRPQAGDPLALREARWEVARLLAEVPRKQAAAIFLVDVQDYTIDDAAAVLGVHRGTVSRARQHGLRAMRKKALCGGVRRVC
ncbi:MULTISPECIES: RNA polymerase sigma factor [Streptomyces]|uniref:RNA polymerase sigma factor n=1 Tax=Streptomyces TaxID=1883 RepID=UPI00163CD159|nr:RNA polymerase sigma factor [Streptomyces sp. WAC05292]